MIRSARPEDIPAVAAIYTRIHDQEEAGLAEIGWARQIYPTAATAEAALGRGDLYVSERDGALVAAAVINRLQVPEYALARWSIRAREDEVLVLHTLVVDPLCARRGYGRDFVAFYETMAARLGCRALRMDTNARNRRARAMYARLGFTEVGIVPCEFNGIPGVSLVCLEKAVH